MLSTQRRYLEAQGKMKSIVECLDFSEETIASFSFCEFEYALKNAELVVPVVGGFSAGKSELINTLIGEDYLPVGVTPETSLATELRFSVNERIEAVKKDDSFDTFSKDEISAVSDKAADYKFMRVYLNNQSIKDIDPLVIVDMPGFESPLDEHNRAIMEYIERGVHYVILIDSDRGTVTRSMLRQIEQIIDYKRSFSILISKSDLKTNEVLDEIKEHILNQIKSYTGQDYIVYTVSSRQQTGKLKEIVSLLDPEELFGQLFEADVREQFASIEDAIATSVVTMKESKAENERAINEIRRKAEEIGKSKEKLLREAREKYSGVSTNSIVEAVASDLAKSADEVVDSGISSGNAALKQRIFEITRTSLISHTKRELGKISDTVIGDIISSLNPEDILDTKAFSADSLEDISARLKDSLKKAQSGLKSVSKLKLEKKDKDNYRLGPISIGKKTFKTLSTILAVVTDVVAPVLEILIVFLPDLIKLFTGDPEKKQRKAIRDLYFTEVIPEIKRKLRRELPGMLDEQIGSLISEISDKLQSDMNEKLAIIKDVEMKKETERSKVAEKVKKYEAALNSLQSCAI